MSEPQTDPPPAANLLARALRAIGLNLDALGRAFGLFDAKLSGLEDMGNEDAKTLRRIEGKLDAALSKFGELADDVDTLKRWRGEHERDHTRQ